MQYSSDNLPYEKVGNNEPICIAEEVPFDIPDSWEWVRLGNIINISSGKFLPASSMIENGIYPVYGGNGINGYHNEYIIDKPTLIIGRVGFYCGCIHLCKTKAWVTDNAFITSFSENNIDINFLKWLLISSNLGKNDNATAQPVVSAKKIYAKGISNICAYVIACCKPCTSFCCIHIYHSLSQRNQLLVSISETIRHNFIFQNKVKEILSG